MTVDKACLEVSFIFTTVGCNSWACIDRNASVYAHGGYC